MEEDINKIESFVNKIESFVNKNKSFVNKNKSFVNNIQPELLTNKNKLPEKKIKIIGNNIILDKNINENKIIEASQKYIVKPNNNFKIDVKDNVTYNKIDKDENEYFILKFKIINNIFTSDNTNLRILNILNFYKQEFNKINNVEISIHINHFPKKSLLNLLNNINNINYEITNNSILILKIKTIDTIIEPTILDYNLYLCNYINNINIYYNCFNINKYITDYSRINFNKNKNRNILEDLFDYIFIIHSEKDIDKIKNILLLYENNLSFFIVDAIDYDNNEDIYNFTIYCIYRNFYEDITLEKQCLLNKKLICVNLSNQLILNYCLTKKINKLLILEDNIFIHKNYINLITKCIENIPDYNLLWLNYSNKNTNVFNNYLNIPTDSSNLCNSNSYVINNCINKIKQSLEICNRPIEHLLLLNLLNKYSTDINIFINTDTNINYITELNKNYSTFNNINLEKSYFSYIFNNKLNNSNKIFYDFVDEFKIYDKFDFSKKWCGIIHNPYKLNNKIWNENLAVSDYLNLEIFKKSIKNCSQLFVFSNFLKNKILSSPNIISLNNINISVIKHPTWLYKNIIKFDYNKFNINKNKKLIMIGTYFNKFTSIYLINIPFEKVWIDFSNNKSLILLNNEINYMKININLNQVEIIKYLNENEYNNYLSQNIIFIDIECVSSNNILIECISRNTPIIIKKHPAIVEYLGSNYPLYFEKLEEVENLCHIEKIKKATIYLSNLNKYNINFTKYFIDLYTNLV
jgi:hypothetical protein